VSRFYNKVPPFEGKDQPFYGVRVVRSEIISEAAGLCQVLRAAAGSADRELKLLGELLMKKHLIAAAVAAAVAVPAMAQNVTVYGNADVSFMRQDNTGGRTTTSFVNGGPSTSLVGLRGSEDLGGGLKADFQLEGSMNFANGQLGTTAAVGTDAATSFNREAWVGLSGAFGAVRFGRTDVSAAQGVDGTIAVVAGNLSDFSTEIGVDLTNVIRYTTPTINGFTADFGYANQATTTAVGTTDTTGYSVRYVNGPLDVRVGRIELETSATTIDDQMTAFGVSYNLGFATIAAARNKIKSATAATDHTESGVSISVPLGNGLTVGASLIDQDFTAAASSDKAQAVLAIKKDLSKRTNVYAVYLDTNFTGGTSLDTSSFRLGVQHSF
jgi:predicted porin